MPKSKSPKVRNWLAVAAHFRKGGAMRHKNAPRGGASRDQEIEDELDQYQTDEARKAVDDLFDASPEELAEAAVSGTKTKEK